jgi:hypothetical protein
VRAKNECEVKRRKPRVVLMTNGGRIVKPTAIVCGSGLAETLSHSRRSSTVSTTE